MTENAHKGTEGTLKDAVEAAVDWWREAGVDASFADEPTEWLAPIETETKAQPQPEARADQPQAQAGPTSPSRSVANQSELPKIDPASLPANLTTFTTWFTGDNPLIQRGTYKSVAPRGAAQPQLMLLVEHPEESDIDTLLSGPQGAMVTSMLRAMQIESDSAYIASALPNYQPLPEWPALASAGLADMIAHHAGLVAPTHMIVFSRALSRLLASRADGIGRLLDTGTLPVPQERSEAVPVLAAPSLEEMLGSPSRKRTFWQAWLNWTRK